MSKTIETNLSLQDLKSNKSLAEEKDILSTSGTASVLSASFSKDGILALLRMDGCTGIRLYPAINNNELIMIAWPVSREDDLSGQGYSCLASVGNGATQTKDTFRDSLSMDLAERLIKGEGAEQALIDQVHEVRKIEGYNRGLKVIFNKQFFPDPDNGPDFERIDFDVVDLKLNDSDNYKSMIGRIIYKDGSTSQGLSLLPCPPNCGGTYGQSTDLKGGGTISVNFI